MRSPFLSSFVCGLAAAGCAPASFVGGHPSAPIVTHARGVTASLNGVSSRAGSFIFDVTLQAPAQSRVERASLTHASSDIDRCDAKLEACDDLDARFTTGTSATVRGNGERVFLLFPTAGTLAALADETHLLLDLASGGKHQLLDLDLSREHVFRGSAWGLGGAVRYRPPGFMTQHFGHEVSGELGVDRWFSATRLRLGYEVGFASCRGTDTERAHCQGDDLVIPFAFGLNATQYLRLGAATTLGVGIGYEGVAILGRFRSQADHSVRADPFLHGPRLALLFTQTPRLVSRFAPEPPKTNLAFELSLELLGRSNFEQPVLLPALGYSYTFGS
jgi:hypothetical protein